MSAIMSNLTQTDTKYTGSGTLSTITATMARSGHIWDNSSALVDKCVAFCYSIPMKTCICDKMANAFEPIARRLSREILYHAFYADYPLFHRTDEQQRLADEDRDRKEEYVR